MSRMLTNCANVLRRHHQRSKETHSCSDRNAMGEDSSEEVVSAGDFCLFKLLLPPHITSGHELCRYTIFKDHVTLSDYEIHDGMNLELYYQ
ncbi:ubiquitin-like protein 5 isoform X1 [Pseudophryne corroboree]|uniref:ubiquitin-like protein 5 isoform X1 n=1 Tax=Pseudophryne corroboree TaxID=495146 RepID=UPI00308211F7